MVDKKNQLFYSLTRFLTKSYKKQTFPGKVKIHSLTRLKSLFFFPVVEKKPAFLLTHTIFDQKLQKTNFSRKKNATFGTSHLKFWKLVVGFGQMQPPTSKKIKGWSPNSLLRHQKAGFFRAGPPCKSRFSVYQLRVRASQLILIVSSWFWPHTTTNFLKFRDEALTPNSDTKK